MEYTIRYRCHWYGPCEPLGDTKEETIIRSDGLISARRYDHHGPHGHYQLIKKASGSIAKEEADRLYEKLMKLVSRHDGVVTFTDDTDTEVIIEEAGLKISIDGGFVYQNEYAGSTVEEVLKSVKLNWQAV
ncbi:MAG: hypothetical protein J6S49_06975 [Erysipelotrichaceae bacterium]|nr:hypothetical protein [Erysipelotrichaceae bacterium]